MRASGAGARRQGAHHRDFAAADDNSRLAKTTASELAASRLSLALLRRVADDSQREFPQLRRRGFPNLQVNAADLLQIAIVDY